MRLKQLRYLDGKIMADNRPYSRKEANLVMNLPAILQVSMGCDTFGLVSRLSGREHAVLSASSPSICNCISS